MHEDMLSLDLSDFKLPPPGDLSEDSRLALMRGSIFRIRESAEELRHTHSTNGFQPAGDMWMLLVVRMITRVAVPGPGPDVPQEDVKCDDMAESRLTTLYSRQDALRQTLCEYIMDDLPTRSVLLFWIYR